MSNNNSPTKQLVIFPKGSITPKDKERMSKEGYLAIEAEDPSRVVMPFPASTLTADDILACAAKGLGQSGLATQAFGEAMRLRILSKEAQ